MDIKKELNEKQYEASSTKSQYLRIIAGAGTGKTRTLTYRIAYLITEGMLPRRMLAITFTNKAAKEMRTRVDDLLITDGFKTDGKPLVLTFHGFCYRFLRKEIASLNSSYNKDFMIADDEDTNAIYKDIFKTMTKGSSKDFTKAVTNKIADLKTKGYFLGDVTPQMIPVGEIYNFQDLEYVYGKYESYKQRSNLLDFDDLLMLTVKILRSFPTIRDNWRNKYDIILVDEFQDTNDIQYDLIKLLLNPKAMLTVVGDPDQTIYTWRGAKNGIIKDSLQKDFPSLDTVVLDDNYRSTQSILDASNSLIKHNQDRMEKNLHAASNEVGDPVSYFKAADNDNEAYYIANTIAKMVSAQKAKYSDFAVIYRSNYLSNSIEKQLTNFRVPYEIYGGLKFFERAEIKDALSYLRLIINTDDISFMRILKSPSKGIGDVTLESAKSIKDLLPEEEANLFNIFRNHRDKLKLTRGTIAALDNFYRAYDEFEKVYLGHKDNDDLITGMRNYFEATGFNSYVSSEDKKAEEKLSYTASSSTSKVDNVQEFIRSLTQFLETDVFDENGESKPATLEDYLMDVALQSDQDTMTETDRVSLMTGHVSKGLEFPFVFVTGLNQMVFPTTHAMMAYTRGAIEEERRLLYVCMTRAKKKLFLSSFGGTNFRNGENYQPSMFLKELNILSTKSTNNNEANNYDAHLGNHRARHSIFNNASASFQSLMQAGVANKKTTTDTYVVGDKVIHTSFGVGVVKEVDGNKIVVAFPEPYGTKKLMVGFKAFRKMREDEK